MKTLAHISDNLIKKRQKQFLLCILVIALFHGIAGAQHMANDWPGHYTLSVSMLVMSPSQGTKKYIFNKDQLAKRKRSFVYEISKRCPKARPVADTQAYPVDTTGLEMVKNIVSLTI